MSRVAQRCRTTNPLTSSARRRAFLRPCPRCNQWRTATQFASDAPVCGACLPRWKPTVTEVPQLQNKEILQQRWSTAELIAELEWLLTWDTSSRIAHRLGVTVVALERRAYRANRPDLARKIRAAA